VRLAYPTGGSRRTDGAWGAYVEVLGEEPVADVGAALLESGYALAAGTHERAAAYEALEAAARAAGSGLLAAPQRE
jgi:endonuclease YncB( thermonuclease family)